MNIFICAAFYMLGWSGMGILLKRVAQQKVDLSTEFSYVFAVFGFAFVAWLIGVHV